MAQLWAVVAVCLAMLLLLVSSEAELQMVYSIQRHGARDVLPKTALLAEPDALGGPTLLPQGQRQCYNAGSSFRTRYINDTTCGSLCLKDNGFIGTGDNYGVLGQSGVGYGSLDVLVRSSDLVRTIMSGLSFFSGVFPATNTPNATVFLPTGAQVVPVHSAPDENDFLVRAYTKCPAYNDRLLAFYQSDEFLAKSAETATLRQQIKVQMPSTDVSLSNWWNVYDAINVYRTYGLGEPTPTFDDATFAKITALAYWLETAKMRSDLTGNLLGGVLLGDILDMMQATVTATMQSDWLFYKLPSISSHYNTILGLLGALEVDKFAPAANFTWFTNIPKLASVMVFELNSSYTNGQWQFDVKLVAQDGPTASYVTVPLPCSDATNTQREAGACSFADFVAYAKPKAIYGSAQWCSLCQNKDAPACVSTDLAVQLQALQASASKADNNDTWKIVVAGVVSGVGMLIVCTVLFAVIFLHLKNDPSLKFSPGIQMDATGSHYVNVAPQAY